MPATHEIQSTLRVLPGAKEPAVNPDMLVLEAQKGSAQAVRDLYLCHHEQIYRFIWSRVHDPDLADDLTGEVFIRMLKNLSTYQDRAVPFRAWLYGIARNLVIDNHRKKGSWVTMPLSSVIPEPSDGESLEAQTELVLDFARVQQKLQQMDPDEREVVELRFLAGLSLKETAYAVNKTVAAVKALQHRGLAALKARLDENKKVPNGNE